MLWRGFGRRFLSCKSQEGPWPEHSVLSSWQPCLPFARLLPERCLACTAERRPEHAGLSRHPALQLSWLLSSTARRPRWRRPRRACCRTVVRGKSRRLRSRRTRRTAGRCEGAWRFRGACGLWRRLVLTVGAYSGRVPPILGYRAALCAMRMKSSPPALDRIIVLAGTLHTGARGGPTLVRGGHHKVLPARRRRRQGAGRSAGSGSQTA